MLKHISPGSIRLNAIPAHLRMLVQVRLASSATSENLSTQMHFPFPTHSRPTPHQIFHLPTTASQADIKSRYYELVREYHPDSVLARHLVPSSSERHTRFQAITGAYDTLCGRGRFSHHGRGGHDDREMYESLMRRRRSTARRRAGMDYDFDSPYHHPHPQWTAKADERWKDWSLMVFGTMLVISGLGPMFMGPMSSERHRSAAANLAEARRDAREYGAERRREIRKRVREYQIEKEEMEHDGRGRRRGNSERKRCRDE
ncbi:hypothetical protein BJ138DRAFT_610925 [Hygrophoropsis aurantiaca]|uniref:Uncharacterized protein n=1 Tax=Hygrophoropsis aurantiaca TaxID=72124 RepID=A0ACB8A0V4_9AGAM|nr:hypothetical protein BJ138DRAFT_610925 [Hygrophoropsis aurantiaca]